MNAVDKSQILVVAISQIRFAADQILLAMTAIQASSPGEIVEGEIAAAIETCGRAIMTLRGAQEGGVP